MNCLGLFLLLATNPDAGPGRDAGIPSWAPHLRPVDTLEGSYALRKWGEGYVYEDARFEARVAPDGTVTFKNRHGSAEFIPFGWLAKSRKQPPASSFDRSARDPYASRQTPWLQPPPETQNPSGKMEQNEVCPPSSSCWFLPTTNAIGVTVSFDLTDEIMRTLGRDPYARDKARFLSATFEFRIKLAIEERKRQMKKALDDFPRYLDDLWADTRYSSRERRRILYELWYEMDNTPEGDRAARMIDGFVRRRLPCGTADGYTPGELDAFRRSHPDRPFRPGETCGQPAVEQK
jgi:hypothetical protein